MKIRGILRFEAMGDHVGNLEAPVWAFRNIHSQFNSTPVEIELFRTASSGDSANASVTQALASWGREKEAVTHNEAFRMSQIGSV